MSLLKSFNRHMERNQAVRKALLAPFDQSTITDMSDFNEALWVSINQSVNDRYLLELINDEETSLDFIIKVLVKIGFNLEDAVRLMMAMYKEGRVILAKADEPLLISLQEYISVQAKAHACLINIKIRVT